MKLGSVYPYLFYIFLGYLGNVDFYKQALSFFTCKKYVNQIVLLNVYSNCKPMVIIQNVYSLTQVD